MATKDLSEEHVVTEEYVFGLAGGATVETHSGGYGAGVAI